MRDELTRRDLGWVAAKVFAAASGAEFFESWLHASTGHSHAGNSAAPPEPDRWPNYQPKFFSPSEFRMLEIYSAILIPTDDTPGAHEAHVAPFIDFVVNAAAEYAPEMQTAWRTAMEWLAKANFQELSEGQRVTLVRQSSAPERDRKISHEGYPTYRLIKSTTIRAFYTSRAGLVDVLEYKGLAYLTQFPACDHPEHKKV
ncbi:MAG: gluconate 2-dehydrogenase subunit 3 family protein [Bryobacteraceae bacterium]